MGFKESEKRWVSPEWEGRASVWVNGEILPWKQNKIHTATPAVQYGSSGFDAFRYRTIANGRRAIFRLHDHLNRAEATGEQIYLPLPFNQTEIRQGIFEVLRRNKASEGYIRLWFGEGYGQMGIGAEGSPVDVSIFEWDWTNYLPSHPIDVHVVDSNLVSAHTGSIFPTAKTSANYEKSKRAKRVARSKGSDEAIILNSNGFVTEASAQNIFVVRNGELETPDQDILNGVIRMTNLDFARMLGVKVNFRSDIEPEELFSADEIFLTGTATGIVGVGSVDGRNIGDGTGAGEYTRLVQKMYNDAIYGRDPQFEHWLTYVP